LLFTGATGSAVYMPNSEMLCTQPIVLADKDCSNNGCKNKAKSEQCELCVDCCIQNHCKRAGTRIAASKALVEDTSNRTSGGVATKKVQSNRVQKKTCDPQSTKKGRSLIPLQQLHRRKYPKDQMNQMNCWSMYL
jgi:hypothetical protein